MDSDRELVRAISTRQAERALEQILHKHGPMVMGVCRRVLGDHHEAEDAFQATFIVLVRKRHSLFLRKTLGAWLHGVALRIAMKAKAMGTQHRLETQLQGENLASRERDHSERIAWTEIGRILDDEIQRLPEMLRTAIILCELEGRSHKEAAQELGIPPGTLSARVARAKEKLRQRLTRRGVTITTAGLSAAISAHATAGTLSSGQVGAALQTAIQVLSGKAASLAAAGTLALALADAVSRKVIAGKILALTVTAVIVIAGVATAIVFHPARVPNSIAGGAPFVDPLMTAERAVMHLGEQAFRHRSSASRLAFLPDGNRLASISSFTGEGGVFLWDVTTGRMLSEFPMSNEETNWPRCLAASPSGNMLAVGQNSGEVSLLDVDTGRELFRERPDARAVTAIAFMPDGTRIVTANMDGFIRISSAEEFGRELHSWRIPSPTPMELEVSLANRASAIAVSPDGQRTAVGNGATGAIYVFAAESGELLTTIEKAHGRGLGAQYPCIDKLEFTADGRQLISGGHRMVERATTPIDHGPTYVQVVEARMWNVDEGTLVRDLIDVDIAGEGILDVSSDGESFVTRGFDAVQFWRVGDAAPRHEIPMADHSLGGVSYSPDGRTIAVATSHGITLWDAQTAQRKFHERPPRYSSISSAAWSSHNEKLAIGYRDGIELWNAATGELEDSFELGIPAVEYVYPPTATDLAFLPDGQFLVCAGQTVFKSGQRSGLVQVWDTISRAPRTSITIDPPLRSTTLSDDGSVVAVITNHINQQCQLSVYELLSGKLLGRFPKEVDDVPRNDKEGIPIVSAARIPAGSTKVFMACENGFCFYWDYASQRPGVGFFADQRTDGRACEVRSAVFSPDAKTLVTSGPGKLCLWNTETEALEYMEVVPMANRWLYLGISHDGRRLVGAEAYAHHHNTLRIWDVPSRKLELTLQVPNARAAPFTFSPDNTKLVTGLDRGTAMIWDVRRDEH